ncbi:MAG TPA: PA2778 family cysteine peptidase [Gammaproteobacteria bacterium]|nr:PA2778 family cysteine peptidase [Gammaproteobacteria bacterium]
MPIRPAHSSEKHVQLLAAATLSLPLIVLQGCSSLQHRQLASGMSGLPPVYELEATPFYPQEIHHCGPAALATVLETAGRKTDVDELTRLVYLPGREGSLAVEMAAAVRRLGYLPYPVPPELVALFDEIAHGHPVVVLQNLGLSWLPRWHYAVAIGYDLARDEITLRSGTHRSVLTNIATFERTWRRGDYWALLVLPPGEMPARADAARYLQAAAGLERSNREAARRSYQAAVERWPENLMAWMALGNGAYAGGDRDTAAAAYRRALSIDDAYAPAYNNLAQTLADRKQWSEAEAMSRRALEIGGAYIEDYQATLDGILRNKPPD